MTQVMCAAVRVECWDSRWGGFKHASLQHLAKMAAQILLSGSITHWWWRPAKSTRWGCSGVGRRVFFVLKFVFCTVLVACNGSLSHGKFTSLGGWVWMWGEKVSGRVPRLRYLDILSATSWHNCARSAKSFYFHDATVYSVNHYHAGLLKYPFKRASAGTKSCLRNSRCTLYWTFQESMMIKQWSG